MAYKCHIANAKPSIQDASSYGEYISLGKSFVDTKQPFDAQSPYYGMRRHYSPTAAILNMPWIVTQVNQYNNRVYGSRAPHPVWDADGIRLPHANSVTFGFVDSNPARIYGIAPSKTTDRSGANGNCPRMTNPSQRCTDPEANAVVDMY